MNQSASLYNSIGSSYNNTRQADPYIVGKLIDLLCPQSNGHYLDVGCGTGNYTIAISEKGFQFTGLDPSGAMLSHARLKSSSIQWIKGTAEQIPLPDATFHGALATLTIHHWQSLQNGFTEISRVLKEKGRLVIFTATPEQMQGYWLNHYFPQILKEAIAKMPSSKEIQSVALRAGFQIVKQEKYFIRPDLKDSFLYVGKHNPEFYFRDAIRQGISSFASNQNKVEVEQGLCRLQHDIKTKEFESVQKRFDNNMGDYLFICAQK